MYIHPHLMPSDTINTSTLSVKMENIINQFITEKTPYESLWSWQVCRRDQNQGQNQARSSIKKDHFPSLTNENGLLSDCSGSNGQESTPWHSSHREIVPAVSGQSHGCSQTSGGQAEFLSAATPWTGTPAHAKKACRLFEHFLTDQNRSVIQPPRCTVQNMLLLQD